MMILFTVIGQPKPQGSKIPQVIYGRDGKPVVKDGRVLTRVRDDNPNTKDWRYLVARTAQEEYDGELLTGPIRLSITFERPRPKSHYGTGRNAGKLKQKAPTYPTTKPDTVKLTRAVEDALTGVIWKDDSQVVVHELEKVYGERYACHIGISTLTTEAGG
jgi:crossover junction endodeoxyribonuclease RusA